MPIYEFRCKGCGQKFERRLSSADVSGVTCPQCGSSEVSRLISLFFSPKSSQDVGVVGCDRCAGNPPPFCEPGGCPVCE
ncbi:MAG: hypothetical protein KatS3mg022_0838 [Armatimonadota bacterium]|nr:MAG: hypothetical protein KatS3mg022_0838 [Armatimonadota bacterium]